MLHHAELPNKLRGGFKIHLPVDWWFCPVVCGSSRFLLFSIVTSGLSVLYLSCRLTGS